jgi:hypothetical protein
VVAKRTGLAKHCIDQGGLSVVYVGNDCNVAQVISRGQSHDLVLVLDKPWHSKEVQDL